MRKQIDELEEQASAPDLWDDQAKAQQVTVEALRPASPS